MSVDIFCGQDIGLRKGPPRSPSEDSPARFWVLPELGLSHDLISPGVRLPRRQFSIAMANDVFRACQVVDEVLHALAVGPDGSGGTTLEVPFAWHAVMPPGKSGGWPGKSLGGQRKASVARECSFLYFQIG